jgi:hypothetical protein
MKMASSDPRLGTATYRLNTSNTGCCSINVKKPVLPRYISSTEWQAKHFQE